jgi:HEAT repeat protein
MTRSASSRRPWHLAAVAVAAAALLGASWLLSRPPAPPTPPSEAGPLDSTVQRLIAQLDQEGSGSVEGLVAVGEPAVPALVAALNDPDNDRRARIIEVLERLRSPAAVGPLLALLPGAASDVRVDAVAALGGIGDRAAVLPLQATFASDPSPQVRYEALTSLGRIGDPRSIPLLVDATAAADQYARLWSIDALCVMGAPPARDAALRLLDDPSPYVRRRVLRVCAPLLNTAATDAAAVTHAVADPDFETTVWARRLLAQRLADGAGRADLVARIHAAADPLLTAATPTSPERLKAVFLLAELRDGAMIDALVLALGSPDVLLRQHAAFLLGQDGSARAVPGLVGALSDSQALVRETARTGLRALAQRGDPTAAAALRPGS